jgi:hypothetical protein
MNTMQLNVVAAEPPKINERATSKLVNGRMAVSVIPRIGMQTKKHNAPLMK